MENELRDTYTPRIAAGLLGVKPSTIYKWVREGKLKTFRFFPRGKIYILAESVNELLKKGKA